MITKNLQTWLSSLAFHYKYNSPVIYEFSNTHKTWLHTYTEWPIYTCTKTNACSLIRNRKAATSYIHETIKHSDLKDNENEYRKNKEKDTSLPKRDISKPHMFRQTIQTMHLHKINSKEYSWPHMQRYTGNESSLSRIFITHTQGTQKLKNFRTGSMNLQNRKSTHREKVSMQKR